MTREQKLERAGEYVLGVMDDAERAEFERTMEADAELAQMVRNLAIRMHALDEVPAGPVDAGLWMRIESRLDSTPQVPRLPTATAAPPAPVRHRATAPLPRQWLTIAASVVVATALGYFAGTSFQVRPEPTMIAVLLTDDASPGAIVEAFADDSVTIVTLQDFVVPEGRVLQVWTLPDPETGPVSLGTLDASRAATLTGPDLPLPQDGQLYEITLEPSPGSPTGRPTGPILVKGFAKPPV